MSCRVRFWWLLFDVEITFIARVDRSFWVLGLLSRCLVSIVERSVKNDKGMLDTVARGFLPIDRRCSEFSEAWHGF